MSQRLRCSLSLAALAAVIAVPSLFLRDLWNPDEPRYAEVAREMRVMGDFLIPHLNGETYAEKPPLFFWLSAGLQSAGFGYSSGRIVAALCLLGTLLLTFELGRLLLDPKSGRLAAAVLATSFLFDWVGKSGVLDVPLTFLTTLSVVGLVRHRLGKRGIALFYIGMGLGTLTKGPVAILIPCLAAASFHLCMGAGRGSPGRRHWVWGIPLMAAIVLAWLVPAVLTGGESYRQTVLFKQNVGRVVSSWSHRQPFYYYLVRLPGDLFPWSIVLPAAAMATWRRGREGRGFLIWGALGLIVFSLVSGKRERYLLPFYPAVALGIAPYLSALVDPPPGMAISLARRLLRAQHAIFAMLAMGFLTVSFAGTRLLPLAKQEEAAIVLQRLVSAPGRTGAFLAGASLLAVAVLGFVLAGRGRLGGAIGATVASALVLSAGCDLVLVPALDLVKSPRPVAELVNRTVPPGRGEVAMYPNEFAGAFNLYTGRVHMPVLTDPREIDPFLRGPAPRLVLTSEDFYLRDRAAIQERYELITGGFVGQRRMVLLVKP